MWKNQFITTRSTTTASRPGRRLHVERPQVAGAAERADHPDGEKPGRDGATSATAAPAATDAGADAPEQARRDRSEHEDRLQALAEDEQPAVEHDGARPSVPADEVGSGTSPPCSTAAQTRSANTTLPAAQSASPNTGNPNVGKSVLFSKLTGKFVIISNYPGTTVEIARGEIAPLDGETVAVIDTPGVNELASRTCDAQVTCDVLRDHPAATIVQVADAKNLRRALLLTLQLAELGRPEACPNMMDETGAVAAGGLISASSASCSASRSSRPSRQWARASICSRRASPQPARPPISWAPVRRAVRPSAAD